MLLIISITACAALPTDSSRTVLETSMENKYHGWQEAGTPLQSDPKRLYLALRQRNLDTLEETAILVSTPSHPSYGEHLDLDVVNTLVGPSEEAVDAVISWLNRGGVPLSAMVFTTAKDFPSPN